MRWVLSIYIAGVISFFSCQRRDFNESQLIKALVNHSFYPLTESQARELVKRGEKGVREKDKNFKIIRMSGRKISKKEEAQKRIDSFFPFILKKQGSRYLIIKVFDYSISYEAGLRNGILLNIDEGILTEDPCTTQANISKRDALSLTFNDGKADWKMVVKREINAFPFVWSMMINDDTAYINIISLTKNSSMFFKNNLMNLKKRGAKKIIVDLRDVSAGNYEEVAKIIGFFSKDGRNYFIKSSKDGYSKRFQTYESIFKDLKTAVLVNKKTTLLGEITAQALKEWGAIVIGEKTQGMVYITKLFKVGNESVAQLSVAKLYPPSGIDMDDGINPDFNITYTDYKKYSVPYVINCDPAVEKAEEILGSI